VPIQAQKAKALKLRKNAQKVLSASKLGASPPRKQRRLGWKPVNRASKRSELDSGPSTSVRQASSSRTAAAAEPPASQVPSSSQMNSSFTDRLMDADVCFVLVCANVNWVCKYVC